uniref:uncharacterized protein LOC122602853 isoform X2 n=1 Tax=Erigeron canadensis TaxID=72917 RepID=UPI001CB8C9ED|nr:uncharacterized protein LOC122602853 isoform X2 [Erigeron canadensis]
MASDNRRSSKRVKDNENVNLNEKKTPTCGSPASSVKRLSKESPLKKQTIESPVKEGLSNTRKSSRLEGRDPIAATPVKKLTTPVKRSDRVNKVVKKAGSPSLKSKKGKNLRSLKHCLMDTSEHKKDRNKGSDVGGRKRKREAASVTLSAEPQRVKTEGEDSDHESQEKSSKADSSSSSDVEELEKPDEVCQPDTSRTECSNFKSLEGKDGNDGECSDKTGEDFTPNASIRQSRMSYMKESPSDATCDTEMSDKSSVKDRTACEADGAAEAVEMIKGVKNIKSGVLSVSGVPESIWDTREVEVSDTKGLQKQYFVKYKGLAHIHNQWVSETRLLVEDSLLVENFSKNGSMKWSEEWTVPHKLLKKRLLLSLEPLQECQKITGKVLKYHHEWLVQWQALGYEQATWESESNPVLDSPEGHNLIKEYEWLYLFSHHGNKKTHVSSNDKTEEMTVKLPSIPTCSPPGMENIHLGYVKNLHDAWSKGQTSLIFDDQERIMRIVLFILSLKDVTLPFLLITTSDSISLWEAMLLKIVPCNALKVSLEDKDEKRTCRLLQVHKESGQLAFQILLYHVETFVKDLNMLKSIKWEAVTVDESQSSEISAHFSHIKSLTTNKRLLVFCGPLGVSMTSYVDVLSLLDCDVISKTELDDISKLKETLSKLIAYECKSGSYTKFVEFWVPVQISNVQLEQYCSMLLSNVLALSSYSKSDTVGALHDVLVSNRKCCDHPYIVDQTLQRALTKDLEPAKFLDVGIKASGKLQFLDLILPEMRKRQLRVLILFQPLSGSGKDSASIGDILDDFIRQRFGEDSYERVDGIGMIPSKKQAALNNFNDKERGRFVFLLEYRACLPSIRLSSVDAIIIFDSDWNPANDLRALQKVAIDSQSEQIMIFRLYTSSTLEEKILRLAEHNTTIDSKLLNLSRSTSDALLMWGATYLFDKLDEFHSASGLLLSSEVNVWNKLTEEFLNLISHIPNNTDEAKMLITRVQPVCGSYGKNLPLPSVANEKQPHMFWKNLLVGRNPSWKYLSTSTPRQRKRPSYSEASPAKANVSNDEVGRKRKKNANNIVQPVASKPILEEAEIARDSRVPSHNVSQSLGDASCNEMSFRDLLKLNISKLCEVLRLSKDVKIVVERFLEYVIENYRVVKEPANTLHAFLISLCWIGSALLKHKLDRTQSVVLANKHLDFRCNEEEAQSVYLKLETAKDKFLYQTQNQNKTNISGDFIPPSQPISTKSLDPTVMVEILESQPIQVDDAILFVEHRNSEISKQISSDCHQGDIINLDMSDPMEAQNGSRNSNGCHSPYGHSVLQDLEIQKESAQANEHLVDPSSLPKSNNLQTVEQQSDSHSTLGEQQPDTHSADRVDGQPSNEPSNHSQDSEALSQSVEASVQVSNQAATPHGSQLFIGHGSDNHNQGVSRMSSSDPLQAELEKLCELKVTVNKCHEAIKVKLKSEHEKELEEMIARINQKYEARNQDVEAAFHSKRKEIDICFNRVVKSKVLAETFRCKCQDLTPFNPVEIQGGMQQLPRTNIQSSLGHSTGIASYLPARSSGNQHVTELQPPLQIVHQAPNLLSATPCGPPYNTNPSTMPTRTPSTPVTTSTRPSTAIPTATPSRPPSMAIPTSTPSQLPSIATPTSTPSRLPSTVIPTSTHNRPPSTTISISTPNRPSSAAIPTSTINRTSSVTVSTSASNRQPSTFIPTGTPTRPLTTAAPTSTPTRPLPTINPITPSSRPISNINPIMPHNRSSQPPPNINHVTPSTRIPRGTGEIRAPAPHIRPFRPSTSISHNEFASRRVISSQHISSSLPLSQTLAQPPQKPPSLTSNCLPTQDSPSSTPLTSPMVTQASSQPPASVPLAPSVSYQLPPLHSLYSQDNVPATSTSHSQMSLPPMPSIPISNTGLYSASDRPTPGILSQPALDLLKEIDKRAAIHQTNMYSPPSELGKFGKVGNDSGLVCLSDDD